MEFDRALALNPLDSDARNNRAALRYRMIVSKWANGRAGARRCPSSEGATDWRRDGKDRIRCEASCSEEEWVELKALLAELTLAADSSRGLASGQSVADRNRAVVAELLNCRRGSL